MKYTKAQRHKIYKKALSLLKGQVNKHGFLLTGICYVIQEATKHFEDTYDWIAPLFPEFAALKPNNIGSYWWPHDDLESRVEALKSMIKQTAPKKKKL